MKNNLKPVSPRHSEWKHILESENYLLHYLDPDAGFFGFLHTSRDLLSTASFIDGRSPISIDATLSRVAIADALAWLQDRPSRQTSNRLIFHSSFCGSTLLARVLDFEGKTYVHKEPNILAQLSDLKLARHSMYLDSQTWRQLINFTLSQLNMPWSESEACLIKPSNWVNAELRDLITLNGASKAVFLSQTPLQFLTAVFRGGGERIQYVYSLLKHIHPIFPEFHTLIQDTENSGLSTTHLFARLILITYAVQGRAFEQAKGLLQPEDVVSCQYNDLVNDPLLTVSRISQVLDLNLSRAEIELSIAQHFHLHSKVQSRFYRKEEMAEIDAQVQSRYKTEFKEAMQWASTYFDDDVYAL